MRLTAKHGRLSVTLRAVRQGQDLQVICSGGEAHIGAVALASPHPSTEVADGEKKDGLLAVSGHREDMLAARTARRLANELNCVVCVTAGIHFDSITKEEIERVLNLVDVLTERCLTRLKQTPKECSC